MTQQCSVCGQELTAETGWAMSTTLADGAPITLYCDGCNPDKGRGYTLSDLQAMKAENQVQRDLRQVSLMDMLGPDVYFAMKGQR